MEVYNFIVYNKESTESCEIWANNKHNAINTIRKSYPEEEGWDYMLI